MTRSEAGRLGAAASHSTGAVHRGVQAAYAAKALSMDPTLSQDDAQRIGWMLRREALRQAGIKGAASRWSNSRTLAQ